jgi:hypothetical protein
MKKIFLIGMALGLAAASQAQSSKQVHWACSAKKIAERTYEVHLTASISGDYHLYSQDPGGDGPIATSFTFVKSPLVSLTGKPKEEGKLIRKFESAWNHDVRYYEKGVDFVQVVKLKSDVKTSLSAKVEFMVCNDRQCLPPSEVPLQVAVGG